MPIYSYRDRRTGEQIDMPWSGQNAPTSQDIAIYRQQRRQPQRNMLQRAWDWSAQPLTDAPSRWARQLTSAIPRNDQLHQTLNDYVPGLGTAASMYEGFQRGAVEGIGDLASSLTSPQSIALTALTLGSGTAARAGFQGAARGLSRLEQVGGLGLGAHGGLKVAEGAQTVWDTGGKEGWGELGGGLTEFAGGTLAARGAGARIRAIDNPPPPPPITDPTRLLQAENPVLEPTKMGPRFYAGKAGVADAHYGKYTEDMSNLPNPFSENAMNMTWGPEQIGEQVNIPAPIAAELGLGANRRPPRPIVEPVEPVVFNPPEDPGVVPFGAKPDRIDLPAIGNLENRRAVIGDAIRSRINEELALPVNAQGEIVRANIPKVNRGLEFGQQAGSVPPVAPPANVQQPNIPAAGTVQGPNPRVVQMRAMLANRGQLNAAARAMGVPPGIFRRELKRMIKDEGGFLDVGAITEGLGKVKAKVGEKVRDVAVKYRLKASDVERTVPEAVPILQDWMGKRAAAETRGVIEGRKFRQHDTNNPQKLVDIQNNPEQFPDVSSFFKGARERATAADLKLGLKEDYLPQLWDNTPEEISKAFADRYGTPQKPVDPLAVTPESKGRVTMRPSFTLKSVIENYRTGIDMGLKPKMKNVSELVHWYESNLQKAIADREFFFKMKESGLIRPEGKAPQGWASLSSDFFPSFGKKGEARRLYKAHPDVVKAIQNYVEKPDNWGQAIGETAQLTKDIALASGMAPGTALNAHGLNILARNASARGVVRGTIEGIGNLINTGADNPIARGIEKVAPWKSARAFLDANLEDAPKYVERGLNLSTEGFNFGEARHTNPFLKAHGKYFEDPLFQNMVPALKLKHVKALHEEFVKGGMDDVKAMTEASRITNEMYGGINVDRMFRNKDTQNLFRTLLIAPDWLESNVRVGKGLAGSLGKEATNKPYRQMALGVMSAYISANIANKAMSGHFMYENESGHAFQIDTGKTVTSRSGKKKKVYFNPFGTALDALRLPAEAASSAVKGDLGAIPRILKNRMSLPASAIGSALYNEDWRGRALWGKDAYGREIPMGRQMFNWFNTLSDPFTPQYVAAGKEYLTNPDISGAEAALGGIEAPVRFASKPQSKKQQAKRAARRRR